MRWFFNHLFTRPRLLVLAATLMVPWLPAEADTPPDTLVQAWQIDDMITLDPAEIFEFSGAEYGAQVYDRLITYPFDDVENLQGHVAESWEIGDDGTTYRFKIRDGITFHSGNPLTAADVAWSLQRVIKLNKTPSFILSQFGFTAENVDQMIKAIDDTTVSITLDQAYAPTFFLYCLTAAVGSVVDKQEVMRHAQDGDMGHQWLRTASAGSGPFMLRSWKPNENIVIDVNPDYWRGAPAVKRVFTRHIPDPATQVLLLEKGDIDIARNLDADQIKALEGNADIDVVKAPKGAIWYLGLNQQNEFLSKPEVREAFKYLIDYKGLEQTILAGSATIHQSFLPAGFLGAIDDRPFHYDVAKAKSLLDQADLGAGFTVTMDTRNTSPTMEMAQVIQASLAKVGINLEILPGNNKQTLSKYRARRHDIYIGRWGPDYQDPHTNADTFASNPDNSDAGNHTSKLAWRNSWEIPEMSAITAAAVLEQETDVRSTMYQELQREHQLTSPFVIMFQDIEVIASRQNVEGMIWGPSFDDNKYWQATKR